MCNEDANKLDLKLSWLRFFFVKMIGIKGLKKRLKPNLETK